VISSKVVEMVKMERVPIQEQEVAEQLVMLEMEVMVEVQIH